MRKKLDTRFPAARIKKIMQADEEVGKIAMATPVLISKALELFLQDLCHRTYEITLKRGAKTMNSHHLKECVRNHSVFDFLKEIVSRVPDLDLEGGGDTGRRRKAAEGDDESGEEDVKRSKMDVQAAPSRGRGRGRGRGRKNNGDKTRVVEFDKLDDHDTMNSPQLSEECEISSKSLATDNAHEGETSGANKETAESQRCPKDFDLNMELDENGEVATTGKEEDFTITHSQWIGSGIEAFTSAMTPLQLGHGKNILQPEEDYDCEDED